MQKLLYFYPHFRQYILYLFEYVNSQCLLRYGRYILFKHSHSILSCLVLKLYNVSIICFVTNKSHFYVNILNSSLFFLNITVLLKNLTLTESDDTNEMNFIHTPIERIGAVDLLLSVLPLSVPLHVSPVLPSLYGKNGNVLSFTPYSTLAENI